MAPVGAHRRIPSAAAVHMHAAAVVASRRCTSTSTSSRPVRGPRPSPYTIPITVRGRVRPHALVGGRAAEHAALVVHEVRGDRLSLIMTLHRPPRGHIVHVSVHALRPVSAITTV